MVLEDAALVLACLLISPCAALLLGIGVRLSDGVVTTPEPMHCGTHCSIGQLTGYANQLNSAHAGMAVVGCLVIAIGAVCPLVLFRLLAFVDPGTATGAALRQSWADAGGLAGVLSRRRAAESGGSAASASGADGRSGGEAGAESSTAARLSGALGAFGAGVQLAARVAHRAADIGADVLGQTGVGHPGASDPLADWRMRSADRWHWSQPRPPSDEPGQRGDPSGPGDDGGPGPQPPTPHTSPVPPAPPAGPAPPRRRRPGVGPGRGPRVRPAVRRAPRR